jgi:steroid delta-isomerase-like uncharacterized protein
MSTEQNKALVRRYYEEGSSNTALFDELLAPNYVLHFAGSPEPLSGIEAAKQFHIVYLTGFPDLQVTVEDLVAQGEKVVSRWTGRATHAGSFMNIPPTGRRVTVTGIAIVRLEGGKIAEEWVNFDALGLLQQLGVIPAMG